MQLFAGNPTGLLLSPLIMSAFGWRAIFYAFGAVGLPLTLAWLAAVPPTEQPGGLQPFARQPSAEEKDSSSTAVAGKKALSPLDLMSKPATWAIIVVNTINHWGCVPGASCAIVGKGTSMQQLQTSTVYRTYSTTAPACLPSPHAVVLLASCPCSDT